MSSEKLEPMIINMLNQYQFLIPSYQRGYRWTPEEAVALLNDIESFTPKEIPGIDEKTWYCLQPIVVKQLNQQQYEVIDGQQRLTTLYLILHYLGQDFVESRRPPLFSLSYQTREQTTLLLKSIGAENASDESMDGYYIKLVYDAIDKWFKEKESNPKFDFNYFASKIRQQTKVIWYEIQETEPIDIFARLNIGKIALTNAELIKALFLNKSNFVDSGDFDRKQLEISTKWDDIENQLQDDRLWFFISGNLDKKDNRIEIIFDILSKKSSLLEYSAFHTFNHFSSEFKDLKQDSKIAYWSKIQSKFDSIHSWYRERELYHIIGYLISMGISTLQTLLEESEGKTKTEFRLFLKNLIIHDLRDITLDELDYNENRDRNKIKKVLLLYNIQSMLRNDSEDSRFPFDIYKKQKWDIEHITATKDEPPSTFVSQKQWLEDLSPYIEDQQLLNRISLFTESTAHEFEQLFADTLRLAQEDIGEEDGDHISNLALLVDSINRSYKNAMFPVKRKDIIDRDRDGSFIPIGTRNVFLKYFVEYPPKISFWQRTDRDKYFEDLKETLKDYLTEVTDA